MAFTGDERRGCVHFIMLSSHREAAVQSDINGEVDSSGQWARLACLPSISLIMLAIFLASSIPR